MIKQLMILASCLSCLAHADVTLTMSEDGASEAGSSNQSVMQIRDGMLVLKSGEDTQQNILFRQSDNALIQIDHKHKRYTVMDEAVTDKVSEQMNAAMAQMEAQLKNMPPEQRRMLEEKMPQLAGRMNKKAQPVYDIERTQKQDKVAGIECSVVNLSKDRVPHSRACIATAAQMGIGKKDFNTIAAMMTAMQSMAAQFGQTGVPDLDEVGGFPIRTQELNDGNTKISTLLSVSTAPIDAAVFAIPEGYKAVSLGQ